jgi:hypothetical protein
MTDDISINKTCNGCDTTKPLEAFAKGSNGKYGRGSVCKECRRQGIKAKPRVKSTTTKVCTECYIEKLLIDFHKGKSKCKSCIRTYSETYQEKCGDEIRERKRLAYAANPELFKERSQKWKEANPEKVKLSQQAWLAIPENKEKRAAYHKQWYEENKHLLAKPERDWEVEYQAMKNNPVRMLRNSVSNTINKMLNSNGETKRGASITQYLDWGIEDLFLHLESLFSHPDNLTSDGKIWMTWENRGVYDPKTWNDNDPGTWTWQLDHIVPQSLTPYASMTDDNFRKTWALPNLRPLSAKQNVLDGNRRGDE